MDKRHCRSRRVYGSIDITQRAKIIAKGAKSGPTVRMVAIQNSTPEDNTCTVCRANPGHPLAFCQTFVDFSPTQRAEAVAKGKHFFRCLGRKHFSSACKKTTKCTVTDCSKYLGSFRHQHHAYMRFSTQPRLTGSILR